MSDSPTPVDLAWRILRKTIEEADNRYGLELHGRVVSGNEFALDFVCTELGAAFRQAVAYDFLQHDYDADIFAEHGLFPTIRKLAEERDFRAND